MPTIGTAEFSRLGAKGFVEKTTPEQRRAIASKAGRARAQVLSPESRSYLAEKAACARWDKYRAENKGKPKSKRKRRRKTGAK